VRQRATSVFKIGAEAVVSVIRAFNNVAPVTICALNTVAQSSERTANRGGGRNLNMGVATCSVGAVAAQEINAGRHAVVRHLVREVAVGTTTTLALLGKVLADGNLGWIMVEVATGTIGAGTCHVSLASNGSTYWRVI